MNESREAALQGRAEALEEELRIADAGLSHLAERCLQLEQQLEKQRADDQEETSQISIHLMQPRIFYDTGTGFSERYMVLGPENAFQADTHTVTAVFLIPKEAKALRIDPGEIPCYVKDLAVSDDRLRFRAPAGIRLGEAEYMFLKDDPALFSEGSVRIPAETMLTVTYTYYPLQANPHDPSSEAMLQVLADIASPESEIIRGTDLFKEMKARADDAAELAASRDYYKQAAEAMENSFCWRITAPIRALAGMFRRS